MIFRDKKTGALLNIRRDEYTMDRLYFQEIIRIYDSVDETKNKPVIPYTIPFRELQSKNNDT